MEAFDRFEYLEDTTPEARRDACLHALDDVDAGLCRALEEGKTDRVVELSSARCEIVDRLSEAHQAAPVPRRVALRLVDRHRDLERRVGRHLESKRDEMVGLRQKVVAIKRYMHSQN